jgi:hypothetical protein
VDPVPDPLLFFCSARESNPGPLDLSILKLRGNWNSCRDVPAPCSAECLSVCFPSVPPLCPSLCRCITDSDIINTICCASVLLRLLFHHEGGGSKFLRNACRLHRATHPHIKHFTCPWLLDRQTDRRGPQREVTVEPRPSSSSRATMA